MVPVIPVVAQCKDFGKPVCLANAKKGVKDLPDRGQPFGVPLNLHHFRNGKEARISSEKLIAPHPAQGNGDSSLFSSPRDDVGIDAVNGGLIHRTEGFGDFFQQIGFGQLELMMMATKFACHLVRVGGLTEPAISEHDGKRFNRLGRHSTGHGHDGT